MMIMIKVMIDPTTAKVIIVAIKMIAIVIMIMKIVPETIILNHHEY